HDLRSLIPHTDYSIRPELFRFFYHALERLISCFFHQIRIAFDFASNKRFETRSDISPHMLCLHRAPLHKTFCFLDFFAFNFIRRHNEHSYRPFFSFRSYTIYAQLSPLFPLALFPLANLAIATFLSLLSPLLPAAIL